VRLDEVASCAAPAGTCTDDTLGQWNFFNETAFPNCDAITDAYFHCIALEPVTSYGCDADTASAVTPQTGNCADEDAAYQSLFSDTPPPCAQP
jgi:hypothetical protein